MMVTDENYLRGNGFKDSNGMTLTEPSSNKNEVDDIPDYNEAFPQLSSGQFDVNRSHTFFTAPFSSTNINETNGMFNKTTSAPTSTKIDEDRRRKLAIHEKSATTKIVSCLQNSDGLTYMASHSRYFVRSRRKIDAKSFSV